MEQERRPFPIAPVHYEKVWGQLRDGRRLGEIWFPAPPLLLKFLFTSDKLSVQVHPGDAYALEHENSAGKTECWYVVETEPGAQLAVGFRRDMGRKEIREHVRAGTIEQELKWFTVEPGDFIFVPAGTVHAIGPGLTLCEVQEFSDVTYRLYDYGRPRELHLEKALEVIRRHPAAGRMRPARMETAELTHDFLVGCRHFALERFSTAREYGAATEPARFEVLVFLDGEGEIVAEDFRAPYGRQQMWRLPETLGDYAIVPRRETNWLKAYVPSSPVSPVSPVSMERFRATLEQAGVPPDEQRRIVIEEL